MAGFISVHVGAGYHAERYRLQYLDVCKNACIKGVEVLRNGGDSLEAVCVATTLLEDSYLTNAGIGSNLTWDGTVECDASVMHSSGQYGAVGAVSCIKNPVILAKEIYKARSQHLSLNRVPPSFLVGDGALQWAKTHGLTTVDPASMITEKARKNLLKYKSESYAQAETNHHKVKLRERLDTVGAVCSDSKGQLSAAASSGGVLLKMPGRVGQAGMYGAGVWAEQNNYRNQEEGESCENSGGVAIATSGTGEQLVTTLLARTVAQSLLTSTCPALDLHYSLKRSFLDSPFLTSELRKLCGVLVIKTEEAGLRGELLWGHTTETMGLGYMSPSMKKPKSIFSVLQKEHIGNEPIVGGVNW